MDHQVFFAKTYLSDGGSLLTMVPQELRRLQEKGWRFGSYVDQYGDPEYRTPPRTEPSSRIPKSSHRDLSGDDDQVDMLTWEPEKRSRYFNTVFDAFIAISL